MTLLTCGNRRNYCMILAIITSAIIGVITTLLQITAVITVTPAFLWVVFGIAVVYLAVLLTVTGLTNTDCKGVRTAINTLLAGILGTILFSVVLLAITFAATSVIGAIIVGLLLFFFSLTITATACLVKAYTECE